MAPIHAKAEAQQEMLRELIKSSGLGKEATVADWIKKNRAYYHPKMAELAEQWALKNPNVKMPKVEMSNFNGKNGMETTRLVFKEKGQSTIVDIVTQGNKTYFNVDGQKYTYYDIYYDGHVENAVNSTQITFNELTRASKLNNKKAAAYQANLRHLVNSLTALHQGVNEGSARKTSFIDLLLEQAYAAKNGDACIMAGYVTTVNAGSCGGGVAQMKEGCSGDTVRCNPIVYGFGGGGVNCVPKKPATEVSVNCDKFFPVPGKEKELLESVIKSVSSQSVDSRNDFFSKLESDIQGASKVCLGSNFDFNGLKNVVKQSGQTKMFAEDNPLISSRFPAPADRHHRIACATVMNRLFYMGDSQECVRQTLAYQDAGEAQPKTDIPECKRAIAAVTAPIKETGEIKVEPLAPDTIKTLPAVVVTPEKEKKKNNTALWLILGGLGVFALCKLWFCKDDKKKKPTVVTPPTPTTKPPTIPPPVLPPMPVGKPGEDEIVRPGSGGVTGGTTGGSITAPITPTTTGGSDGPVAPRGGAQ